MTVNIFVQSPNPSVHGHVCWKCFLCGRISSPRYWDSAQALMTEETVKDERWIVFWIFGKHISQKTVNTSGYPWVHPSHVSFPGAAAVLPSPHPSKFPRWGWLGPSHSLFLLLGWLQSSLPLYPIQFPKWGWLGHLTYALAGKLHHSYIVTANPLETVQRKLIAW